jgi:hypothetical protein
MVAKISMKKRECEHAEFDRGDSILRSYGIGRESGAHVYAATFELAHRYSSSNSRTIVVASGDYDELVDHS